MFTINAIIRKGKGKGASRRLRVKNKFPAIIYGGKSAPISIELDQNKIWSMQDKIEFYKETLVILIDGVKQENVKVQAIQRHAYKPKLIHIDFIRVI